MDVKIVKEKLPVCICKDGEQIRKEVEVRKIFLFLPSHYISVEKWKKKINKEKEDIRRKIEKLKEKLENLNCSSEEEYSEIECLAKKRIFENELKKLKDELMKPKNTFSETLYYLILPNSIDKVQGAPRISHKTVAEFVDTKSQRKIIFTVLNPKVHELNSIDFDVVVSVDKNKNIIKTIYIGENLKPLEKKTESENNSKSSHLISIITVWLPIFLLSQHEVLLWLYSCFFAIPITALKLYCLSKDCKSQAPYNASIKEVKNAS